MMEGKLQEYEFCEVCQIWYICDFTISRTRRKQDQYQEEMVWK